MLPYSERNNDMYNLDTDDWGEIYKRWDSAQTRGYLENGDVPSIGREKQMLWNRYQMERAEYKKAYKGIRNLLESLHTMPTDALRDIGRTIEFILDNGPSPSPSPSPAKLDNAAKLNANELQEQGIQSHAHAHAQPRTDPQEVLDYMELGVSRAEAIKMAIADKQMEKTPQGKAISLEEYHRQQQFGYDIS